MTLISFLFIPVQAVYAKSHPELLKYIYLVAPISLVFLNPIGFILLEIQKWRNSPPGEHGSKMHVLWLVVKGVIKNPVVFMTALGVIGNFVFQEKVPPYVTNILTVLGEFLPYFVIISHVQMMLCLAI